MEQMLHLKTCKDILVLLAQSPSGELIPPGMYKQASKKRLVPSTSTVQCNVQSLTFSGCASIEKEVRRAETRVSYQQLPQRTGRVYQKGPKRFQ